MTEQHPKYLKKIGAPVNDYHIWTPILAEREDMEPFTPVELAEAMPEIVGYSMVKYSPRWWKIVDSEGNDIEKGLTREQAEEKILELMGGQDNAKENTAAISEKRAEDAGENRGDADAGNADDAGEDADAGDE